MTRRRILLMGYAGHGNFGDDLLLKLAVEAIEASGEQEITIHSTASGDRPSYLRSWFPHARVTTGKLTYRLVAHHDRVLYFGGGVLFDYNKLGLGRYLRRALSDIRLSLLPRLIAGTRFGGIGMGLGPFACDRGLRLAGKRIRPFSLLGVRDKESLRLARLQGVHQARMTPDLSLLLADGSQPMCAGIRTGTDSPRILLCPRHYPHGERKDHYLSALEEAARRLRAEFPDTLMTVFGFQGGHDEEAVASIGRLADDVMMWDPFSMGIRDVMSLFASQDVVISSRMHGIFVAGIAGTPSVAIGVDPKLAYAAGFFRNSAHVTDTAGSAEIAGAAAKAMAMERGKSATVHLESLSHACREEYRRMTTWLRKDEA